MKHATDIDPRPLALTYGDPAGIGADITLAAWSARVERHLPAFVLFGDAGALAARADALGLVVKIARVASPREATDVFATALPVIHTPFAAPVQAGAPDAANGLATIASIEAAVAAVMHAEARAVVTNPIAKHVLYDTGFSYAGHTEFLHALSRDARPADTAEQPVMLLVGGGIMAAPMTVHCQIADVPAQITAGAIRRHVTILANDLTRWFGIAKPRIAVSGLNPHAGESGTIGREDIDIIAPELARLSADGFHVTGPHSADTLFHTAARATYDAALTMYHDQALIPVKTVAFETGINCTLGLAFARTSPDHGTAFDLAGTGAAAPESLISALHWADKIAGRGHG
ncbi:MAG: 4-hydroxythreonine-4-phosphate dehydrogenase PdxA [Pseudomonadota bacterium]